MHMPPKGESHPKNIKTVHFLNDFNIPRSGIYAKGIPSEGACKVGYKCYICSKLI